jgi:hypothetical protein
MTLDMLPRADGATDGLALVIHIDGKPLTATDVSVPLASSSSASFIELGTDTTVSTQPTSSSSIDVLVQASAADLRRNKGLKRVLRDQRSAFERFELMQNRQAARLSTDKTNKI